MRRRIEQIECSCVISNRITIAKDSICIKVAGNRRAAARRMSRAKSESNWNVDVRKVVIGSFELKPSSRNYKTPSVRTNSSEERPEGGADILEIATENFTLAFVDAVGGTN